MTKADIDALQAISYRLTHTVALARLLRDYRSNMERAYAAGTGPGIDAALGGIVETFAELVDRMDAILDPLGGLDPAQGDAA